MNNAEWKDVWSLVVALIGRQSPPVQIFSWLLIVFGVLMFVEGLRATFLSRRVVAQIHRRGLLDRQAIAVPQASAALGLAAMASPPARSGLIAATAARNAKREVSTLNRREPMRPKIRRISSYFEYAGAPRADLASHTEPATEDPVLAEV